MFIKQVTFSFSASGRSNACSQSLARSRYLEDRDSWGSSMSLRYRDILLEDRDSWGSSLSLRFVTNDILLWASGSRVHPSSLRCTVSWLGLSSDSFGIMRTKNGNRMQKSTLFADIFDSNVFLQIFDQIADQPGCGGSTRGGDVDTLLPACAGDSGAAANGDRRADWIRQRPLQFFR